jgi:hypothetical protein
LASSPQLFFLQQPIYEVGVQVGDVSSAFHANMPEEPQDVYRREDDLSFSSFS